MEDLPLLPDIERAAGQRFRTVGLPRVAEDEPPSVEELAPYVNDCRAWVAVTAEEGLVGYILVEEVDGDAHIEQVSVLPHLQGRGVGRALIERATRWASSSRRDVVTLTTFDQVPWNRPLYEHLGFSVIDEEQLGPELKAKFDAEVARDFGAPRVAMSRQLGAHS